MLARLAGRILWSVKSPADRDETKMSNINLIVRDCCSFVNIHRLRSSRFLSFSGGEEIEQANEKRASERARLGWAKKLGRSREGVGRKGTTISVRRLTPSPYCLFCHFFAVFLPFTSVWKGERKTAATQASPPPPTAYFATFTQFSSRSRAFGKGKENGCYAG